MVHDSRTANAIVDRRHTILHVAVLECNVQIVEHLISRKANVNAVSVDGDPPLFASATKGHARIVKLLVEAGANSNLDTGLLASHEN